MSLLDLLNQQPASSHTANLLQSYLTALIEAGLKLPSDKKGPNRTMIADGAGISRQAFYQGRGAADTCNLFEWAVKHIGLESLDAPVRLPGGETNPTVAYLTKALKDAEKRLSKAQETLLRKDAENSELRKQLQEADGKLKAAGLAEDYREKGYEILL